MRRIYIPSGVVSIGRDCFTNAHRSFEIWTEYGATAVQYAIDNSHAYYYLSLTDWHVPGGTLYLGYDFNMYGYVRSTVKVTSVTAAIANASGEVVREASATPNVTNYSIGGGFAEQLSIETLPLGNYTFTLGAVTSKSSETFVSRGFKVQEAPLIVNLSRYSLRSTSMDKGDDRPVTGLLSANYPITRVTFRVAPDEGNAIDNSAAPGTDSYQLSGLGVNLSALEAGDYTVSILVQGHGETVETGKVSIGVNGLTLASGSQIDEGAFDAFIRDRANKEYWLNNFPGIRTYETQAMNVLGYDVYVANGIFFSNAEDYANAYFRDLFSGQNQGFNSPTFYKEMAKEEIKSLINDLGTEGFAEYSYNKTFAEKVAAMFNKGDKLVASMLFDDVDKMTPYEAQYITEWNTIAENLGDMYKIVSNCEDLSEIIVNCTVNFSQGMAVLDAVENDCDYTAEYSRYYQNAVDELRLEFGNYIYNALSRVLNFAAKKVMEEGLSNLTKNVLGAYAKSYSLAKLFYKALDMVGDYKVGKDYVDYMMKMLSYTNAEKNFEEAFQAIVDGDTSDAAKIRLACRFDTVRRCAYRALEKLTSIGYGYDKGIDMQGAFNLYKELYYHTTCPFVVSQ